MNKAQAPGITPAVHFLLALMVLLGAMLVFGFVIFIASIVVGVQQGAAYLHANPFAAYAEVWPGQSLASVAAYARSAPERHTICFSGTPQAHEFPDLFVRTAQWATADPADRSALCSSAASDGTFHQMRVVIVDDRVQRLTLESDVLQADALYLYWGAPDAIAREIGDRSVTRIRWDRSTYSAAASVDVSSSVVKVLTLAVPEPPGEEARRRN